MFFFTTRRKGTDPEMSHHLFTRIEQLCFALLVMNAGVLFSMMTLLSGLVEDVFGPGEFFSLAMSALSIPGIPWILMVYVIFGRDPDRSPRKDLPRGRSTSG